MRRLRTTHFQVAIKLTRKGSVKGRDFSPADRLNRKNRALQAAEKLDEAGFVTGHDFSRAAKADKLRGLQPLPTVLTAAFRKNRSSSAACVAPEVCFLPAPRHNWRFSAACALLCLVASVDLHPQTAPLLDTGHVTVDGRDTAYRIRNLPINAFPELPAPIRETLTARGCVIPQTYQAKRPENVIHASLERPGSQDWAVLCSTQGKVSLLVFFASASASKPAVLASAEKTVRLQAHDPTGELGFNWGIDPATPRQVHDAEASLVHRPPPTDHDCVAESIIDRRTVYHLFQDGSWHHVQVD